MMVKQEKQRTDVRCLSVWQSKFHRDWPSLLNSFITAVAGKHTNKCSDLASIGRSVARLHTKFKCVALAHENTKNVRPYVLLG